MVFILLSVEPGRVKAVSEELLEIPGVYEAYSVAGPYDVVAVARVNHHEDLSGFVTHRVGALGGVESTETLIAFRTFAKKDPGLMGRRQLKRFYLTVLQKPLVRVPRLYTYLIGSKAVQFGDIGIDVPRPIEEDERRSSASSR